MITSWNVGEHNPKAKLTFAQAQEIRRATDVPRRDLAERYGVSIATIGDIQTGRKWTQGPGRPASAATARARYNARRRAKRAERRAAGLCPQCGEPAEPPFVGCVACRAYRRLVYAGRR